MHASSMPHTRGDLPATSNPSQVQRAKTRHNQVFLCDVTCNVWYLRPTMLHSASRIRLHVFKLAARFRLGERHPKVPQGGRVQQSLLRQPCCNLVATLATVTSRA